jgi:cell division protein FtsI/penicillin-binding protein 2
MTPLQVNQMTAVIAAGGIWCRPHLIGAPDCKQLDISAPTIELVRQGMSQVTQTGGTAFPFFDFPFKVAGKTGTAEFGDPQNKTHAWFTGFAPADNPAIVVTVLLEGAGEGSYQAAPVAKELLSSWFSRR